MVSCTMKLLAVVGMICVIQVAADMENVNGWGELYGSGTAFSLERTKYAIPFVRRDTDVEFPGDFDVSGPGADLHIVEGIQVVQTVKDKCETKVQISEGGIGQKFAKVKLRSDSGCGIKATIKFFVKRPQLFNQEIIKH